MEHATERLAPEGRARGAKPEAEGLERGLRALLERQGESGAWLGDYGGALFLTPILVIACYVTRHQLSQRDRDGLVRYLAAHQRPDGGYGLHAEAPGCVFSTTLAYVALRMLGLGSGEAVTRRALEWLGSHGGPLGIPSWGKLVLAVLGLYEYEGMNPVLPELWLLPGWAPIQPGRLWCHSRVVYLPMAYLYGTRARIPEDRLIAALREELYAGSWGAIDWPAQRDNVAPTDLHAPHTIALDAVNHLQARFERHAPRLLRRRALDAVLEQIRYEDETTSYVNLGPVNKLLNTMVAHFADPAGEPLRRHTQRIADYVGHGPDGACVQGYNNSQLWDTVLALQSIASSSRRERLGDELMRGYRFVRDNQVVGDVPERRRFHRHSSRGGWPFSNREHGWPVSDCTAEGLKVALELEALAGAERIPDSRLEDAARLILTFQNPDGGFSSYEPRRAPLLLELLNPSEVFGNVMVEHSYVECTSSCIQGLVMFRRRYPGVLSRQIETAIERGKRFILKEQRADGGWKGSWGVCFTYAGWFAIDGLRAVGLPPDHPAIGRGASFLLARQRADGGWGEHFTSCERGEYVQAESHVVQTAWALLALMQAGGAHASAIARGIGFLESRQQPDGSWPREAMAGAFNETCMLNYDNYPTIFPVWALSRHERFLRGGAGSVGS